MHACMGDLMLRFTETLTDAQPRESENQAPRHLLQSKPYL